MYMPGTVFCCMYSVTVFSVLAECHAAGIKVLLSLPGWHLPVAGTVLQRICSARCLSMSAHLRKHALA